MKRCETDIECKPNSFCFNNDVKKYGNCKCDESYLLERLGAEDYECLLREFHMFKTMNIKKLIRYCILAAKYDESCERDLQCAIDFRGVCLNNKCACGEGSHYYYGKCYKTSGI